jgi:hypothetical protein
LFGWATRFVRKREERAQGESIDEIEERKCLHVNNVDGSHSTPRRIVIETMENIVKYSQYTYLCTVPEFFYFSGKWSRSLGMDTPYI